MHKIIFGDARNMKELEDNSVHLVVTSPPYYNAPFDYPGFFKSYEEFLALIKAVGREIFRVLAEGRIACFVVQDVRIKGTLYPIVSDVIRIMREIGFRYRDKIIWKKPEGYIRISRRSGVLIQHPYPMYYYPDNIYEEIVIFQKGKFNYRKVDKEIKRRSKVDLSRFQKEKWYLSVWEITNVLPSNELSKYTAVYPEELVGRLITLYSYVGEIVLDPFLGTGTTTAVAQKLNRNSIGYEINLRLKEIVEKRLKNVEIIVRNDAIAR